MTKRPRRRRGFVEQSAPDDDRPEVMTDPVTGALVRRTYEDDDADRLDDWATREQAKRAANAVHGKNGVGGADAGELAAAAAGDGATFVTGSARARAHVRHAPPAERKPGNVAVPDGAKVGAPTRVIIGARGGVEELPAVYALVDAAQLITSHDARSFSTNPLYPIGVQERRYDVDRYEQLKVTRNAAQLVAAFLVTDNPDSVNGPPVVTPAGVVLGGNSRAMSLVLAYGDKGAAGYRALLVERAKVFGLAPTDLDGFASPVLVRVVDVDAGRWQDLSRRLNEAQTQEKDVNADAVSLSHRVSQEALAALAADVDPEETLNAYLTSTRSRSFVRRLYHDGVITQQSAGRLLVGSELSEEGRAVVVRVLVALLVPDATTIERMGAARRDLLARVAPGLLKARAVGHDLGPAIRTAVEDVADADARGLSIEQLTAQGSMFALTDTRARDLNAIAVRDLLSGKPARAVRVLRRFAALAADNPSGQTGLFGEVPTTAALLQSAIAADTKE